MRHNAARARSDLRLAGKETLAVRFVIYGLIDPRSPRRIRYVGRTRNHAARYGAHIKSGYPDITETGVSKWVAKLRREKVYPEMILIEETTESLLVSTELHWILALKEAGMADLNTNRGLKIGWAARRLAQKRGPNLNGVD